MDPEQPEISIVVGTDPARADMEVARMKALRDARVRALLARRGAAVESPGRLPRIR
jgi:hypothetical protein